MLGWSFLLLSETTVSGQKKKEIIHSFFSPNFISHEKKNHWFHLYIIFSCVPWLYFPSLKMWKNYFKDFMKTKIMRKNVFSTWFNMKKTFFYPVFFYFINLFYYFLNSFFTCSFISFPSVKTCEKKSRKMLSFSENILSGEKLFFLSVKSHVKEILGKK